MRTLYVTERSLYLIRSFIDVDVISEVLYVSELYNIDSHSLTYLLSVCRFIS